MDIRKKPVESNMYYCKSRYYVPECCRWLNADSISFLNPQNIHELNLFAYCKNNPVMNVDPAGNAWWNPFNNDVNPVISTEGKVSFYKGQAVIKGNFPGCMSFGIMFVDKGTWVTGDVIWHEYGHFLQMEIYGVPKFTLKIAIPSLIGTKNCAPYLYHSQPWEVTADIFGGAKGFYHIKGSEALGWLYFIFF